MDKVWWQCELVFSVVGVFSKLLSASIYSVNQPRWFEFDEYKFKQVVEMSLSNILGFCPYLQQGCFMAG